MHLGDELRRLRETKGLSQEKLAALADIDRTYLSKIERGLSSPTVDKFLDLCRALDVQATKVISKIDQRTS